MKTYTLILTVAALLFSTLTYGQVSDYKIVFDITSADPSNQAQVVRDVKSIKAAYPNAQLEVVVYGEALNLIQKDKSSFVDDIKKLTARKGVAFNACHQSMQRNQVKPSDLIKGVGVVPDGIYEIISKQQQGWGYIKIAQ